MRIRRVIAEQPHAVPERSYDASVIFSRNILRPNPVVEGPSDLDDGGGVVPEGSTAQNKFREVKWFRCNDCNAVVRETHLDGHVCEE